MLPFFAEVTPIETSFPGSGATIPQKQLLLTSALQGPAAGADPRHICLAEVLANFILRDHVSLALGKASFCNHFHLVPVPENKKGGV